MAQSTPKPGQGPSADRPAEGSESPVALRVATWEEVQAAVDSHRGKVVVLDLWATW